MSSSARVTLASTDSVFLLQRKPLWLATLGLLNPFFLKDICLHLFIWLHKVLAVACGIFSCSNRILSWSMRILSCTCELLSCSMWNLLPWPGIECRFPALGDQSLSHWTTREVPQKSFLNNIVFIEQHMIANLKNIFSQFYAYWHISFS